MIGALIALFILGGGGGVVAVSNAAVPGDALYGLDMAAERIRVRLVDDGKKNELKVKFAEERIEEAKTVAEKRRESVNTADTDLSAATLTEVEVDVFTNETTVKIEASDRHYGFITTEKEQAKIVDEIEAKYKLTEASILAVLSFETEDRESRPDDKGFLNSSNSEKEDDDLEDGLNSVSDLLSSSDLSAEEKARLDSALNEILVIMGNNPKAKFKFEDGNLKIEIKKGEIEIKNKNEDDEDDEDGDEDENDGDDNKGHGNDEDGEDDDNPGASAGVNIKAKLNANTGSDNDDDENDGSESDDDSDDSDNEDEEDESDDEDNDSDNDDDDSEDDDDSNDDSDDDNEDDDDDDNSGSGNGGN